MRTKDIKIGETYAVTTYRTGSFESPDTYQPMRVIYISKSKDTARRPLITGVPLDPDTGEEALMKDGSPKQPWSTTPDYMRPWDPAKRKEFLEKKEEEKRDEGRKKQAVAELIAKLEVVTGATQIGHYSYAYGSPRVTLFYPAVEYILSLLPAELAANVDDQESNPQ